MRTLASWRDNRPPLDHSRIQPPAGRRFQPANQGMRPQPPPVAARHVTPYNSMTEATLTIHELHPKTRTYDIYASFVHQGGKIVYIEIFQDSKGQRNGRAKIKFSPPPMKPFWDSLDNFGTFQIRLEELQTYHNARVVFDDHRRQNRGPETIPSPLRPTVRFNATMDLIPSKLQFGLMVGPESFMSMAAIKAVPGKTLSFQLNLKKKHIEVTFVLNFEDPRSLTHGASSSSDGTPFGQLDRECTYKFRVPFTNLKVIRKIDLTDRVELFLSLDNPPAFYRKLYDIEKSHPEGALSWGEFDSWLRATDIVYNPYSLQKKEVSLHNEDAAIDIGRWTSYCFTLDKNQNEQQNFREITKALEDFNIPIKPLENMELPKSQAPEVWSIIDSPALQSGTQELNDALGSNHLPFDVRYQLEVCISREVLNEHSITQEFITRLATLAAADSSKARYVLEYVAEAGKPIYNPMSIFEDDEAMSFWPNVEIPHYCGYTRKVTVTPTTIYLSSPTVEITNRVIREYATQNAEGRFLRVQFTDELTEGKIHHTANKTQNDELYGRVYRVLYNGIRIGDRKYKFLAFGNSQFRENGAYFFCEGQDETCETIRSWMGDFSHINVVAKYAARLGQCFSTTRAIHFAETPDIIIIPDIEKKIGDDVYCFTDGVGKISEYLAQVITAEMKLKVVRPPSAFQFRMGGCKGILAVSPDAKGQQVHVRGSQQKFAATFNGLEIIRWSRYSVATLNRQTITILSSLGVKDEVFLGMLAEQLRDYHNAMSDKALAQSLLTKFVDDNQMTINIATMIGNGFMTSNEPFVLSLLQLWRSWSIKLLKEKARITVEEGAFLLGCIDETNTLKGHVTSTSTLGEPFDPNELPQIFVQIPRKEDNSKYAVVQGMCIVGRNPSLHPGDLRVVMAVNVPALHHLRDVVVFSQQGERDIPSMCSGGDLDGDDFFVIWDKNLRPTDFHTEPMNYQPPAPLSQRGPVTMVDIMKFYVRYMKNDSLPTIAHAHMGFSDVMEQGVKSHQCTELATLHSKAVDYVKTGQPAEIPKRLKCPRWPHFMEKRFIPKEKTYHSEKILGQLYDKVESVDFKPKYEEPFDQRVLRAFTLNDSHLKRARQVKTQYDNSMRRIMAQKEIGTEFEVWTTFILSKPRVGTDYKLQEEMGPISDALKDRYRMLCIEAAGGKDFSVLGPFVAAMYRVTKEELDIALAECRSVKIVGGREIPKRRMEAKFMPLISFPWLFEKELGRLATGVDTSEDDNHFLPPTLKLGGEKRERVTGGDLMSMEQEDHVQLEDGKTIHRGEMLDIFHPSLQYQIPNGEREDAEEDNRSVRDFREGDDYMAGTSGEEIVHTIGVHNASSTVPCHLLSGTGVEDVVQYRALDGLIDPRLNFQTTNNLQSINYRARNQPEVATNSSREELVKTPESNVGESISPNHNSDSEGSGEVINGEDCEESEQIEEKVEIEIKESIMDKLARLGLD